MRILILLLCLALIAGGATWYWGTGTRAVVEYRTATVERGDVVSSISATGTLEPEEVIDVGAQVAGLIQSFGTDADGKTVSYRSPVDVNMVLATIDDTVYRADVDTARAQMDQANASVDRAQADLSTAEAKLVQAENNWARARDMGPNDALSQNDYEMYRADFETAKANVAVSKAQIAQARTSIAQSQAALNKAERNLAFCTIKSPVKGVIIDRRVNIGQTVVSSLNAPSLFLIAKDLSRMQIWVAVNEADIGRVVQGSSVTFTCDAMPEKTFDGVVDKIRLNATMSQNVVMYTVEVNTDNSKGLLLPYLTARVQFEVQRSSDVLTVPNAALRWYPVSRDEVVPEARDAWKPLDEKPDAGGKSSGAAGAGEPNPKGDAAPRERRGTLWLLDGQLVRPLEVRLGTTDGSVTAVYADALKAGAELVVGELAPGTPSATKSPFAPQVIRR